MAHQTRTLHSANFRLLFILLAFSLVLSGCFDTSPRYLVNETIGVEQGKPVTYTLTINRDITTDVYLESKNSQPYDFFIVKDKDYSAYLAGMSVSVYLPLKGYSAQKRVNLPAGKYKAIIRHGTKKGFWNDAKPDAIVQLIMAY